MGIPCYNMFQNGVCDKACNSEGCLFDGHDCRPPLKECNPIYDAYCKKHYSDGHCDAGCNNEECEWDGLDCDVDMTLDLAEGSLVIIVLVRPDDFREREAGFLRDVGHLLRAIVRVKLDNNGDEMIYPWPEVDETYGNRVKRSIIGDRYKRAANGAKQG